MLARARRTAGATVRPFLRALSDAAVRLPLERNTFFDVVSGLPRFGVGAHIKRATWRGPGCYWTVLTVKPRVDGQHGKAWGTLTWDGVTGVRREIRGTLKPLWRSAEPPAPPLAGPRL